MRLLRVAPTPLPVLLVGETGTGKEVAARALHDLSGRAGPFVPVDCGSLSQSLVESELFGHERGAFTGANHRREGLIRAAAGGTFFLDEIGELPLETQTRLLRILEQGTYRLVGGEREQRADIRIVAATWRNLREQVSNGEFRQDLYHRLSIVELTLPPVRERGADADELMRHFLEVECERVGRLPLDLETDVRRHLQRWPWPGNVRELRNAAAYVAAMTPGGRVRFEDLPNSLRRTAPDAPDRERGGGVHVRTDLPYMEARRDWLDQFQIQYVSTLLEEHGGNVSAAARAAGMDRRSIQRILSRVRQIATSG